MDLIPIFTLTYNDKIETEQTAIEEMRYRSLADSDLQEGKSKISDQILNNFVLIWPKFFSHSPLFLIVFLLGTREINNFLHPLFLEYVFYSFLLQFSPLKLFFSSPAEGPSYTYCQNGWGRHGRISPL